MGLPAALRAHHNSDLNLAAHHYKRALDQKDFKPVLFQNYGALLRSLGKVDHAKEIYEQGLKLYPKERGIRLNYANLIKDSSPLATLEIYINLLSEKVLILGDKIEPQDYQMILEILDDLDLPAWSYEISRFLLNVAEPSATLLINLFKIASSGSNDLLMNMKFLQLSTLCIRYCLNLRLLIKVNIILPIVGYCSKEVNSLQLLLY